MAKLWIIEYSGLMKNSVVIFTITNIYPFHVRDRSVSIHIRNLWILATKTFEISQGIGPKVYFNILISVF